MTGTPVQFHLPIGISLDLDVEGAEVDKDGVRITARAEPEAWSYVEGGYLFHLDEAETDDGKPPMLDEDKPVDLVLRLDDELAASLPRSTRKPDTLVLTLSTSAEDSPLLDTESWFLLEAKQGRNGYRTTFADMDEVTRGELHDIPVLEPRAHDGPPREPSPFMALALSFLDSMNLQYDWMADDVVRVPVASDDGTFNMFVHTRDEHRQVTVYATWTEEIPVDRRRSVMELITRINPDLTVSWFELDIDRGSVSARTGLDVEGTALNDVLIENLFYAAERTMERFLPAIAAVTFEGLEPSDVPPPAD